MKEEDNINLGTIFKGFDKFFGVVSSMLENQEDERNIEGALNFSENKDMVGKYNLKIGLGVDKAREMNNRFDLINERLEKIDVGSKQKKNIEPTTEIFDQEDKAVIVMELPGVEENDIHFETEGNLLTVTAQSKGFHYSKTIAFQFELCKEKIESRLNNSLYTLTVQKVKN
ncbi:MAG: hypothetical protein PHG19_11610 [Anaerotignum sp.]|nr:hypothetical protein [Anaerotignum sp.]